MQVATKRDLRVIRRLVGGFDLPPALAVSVLQRSPNTTFLLESTDGRRFSVRRSPPSRSLRSLGGETQVLLEMGRRGQAVPEPVLGPAGYHLWADGAWWVARAWVHGMRPRRLTPEEWKPLSLGLHALHDYGLTAASRQVQRPSRWVVRAATAAVGGSPGRYGEYGLWARRTLKRARAWEGEVFGERTQHGWSTLCHGDVRLANLIRRPGGGVVLLDFDDLLRAHPLWDGALALATLALEGGLRLASVSQLLEVEVGRYASLTTSPWRHRIVGLAAAVASCFAVHAQGGLTSLLVQRQAALRQQWELD